MDTNTHTLRIECQGATTVELDELNEMHHFKNSTDKDYAEFVNSVIENGFSFPVFMWVDPENKKWIIDAHRRKLFLKRMRDQDGWTIPPLPADIIFAESKKAAAKKIIAQESRYGEPDEGLFTEFLAENDITFEEVESYIDIPGIDDASWHGSDDEKSKEPKEITCPSCGHKFTK